MSRMDHTIVEGVTQWTNITPFGGWSVVYLSEKNPPFLIEHTALANVCHARYYSPNQVSLMEIIPRMR